MHEVACLRISLTKFEAGMKTDSIILSVLGTEFNSSQAKPVEAVSVRQVSSPSSLPVPEHLLSFGAVIEPGLSVRGLRRTRESERFVRRLAVVSGLTHSLIFSFSIISNLLLML